MKGAESRGYKGRLRTDIQGSYESQVSVASAKLASAAVAFPRQPSLPSQRPAFSLVSAKRPFLTKPQSLLKCLSKVWLICLLVLNHLAGVQPAPTSDVPQPLLKQLTDTAAVDEQPQQEQPTSAVQGSPGSTPEEDDVLDLIVSPCHELLTTEFEPLRTC